MFGIIGTNLVSSSIRSAHYEQSSDEMKRGGGLGVFRRRQARNVDRSELFDQSDEQDRNMSEGWDTSSFGVSRGGWNEWEIVEDFFPRDM
ncbi:hypothetical protein CAEBREN_24783 [Caenorhabditis brenneri]|uniref:Uncharacterized protein n=1 Tax=Caenorhabditis brenneri TaxID=135651 RepID=G0NQX2_CAEBE|nr:hypothetical protein CAEBREN_24783 [Caenorhabditis brenneri]